MTLYNVQGNQEEAANHIEGESNEVYEQNITKEGETDSYIEEGEIEPVDGSLLDVSGVEEVASAQVQRKWPLRQIKQSLPAIFVKKYTHKRYLTRHLKSHDANAKDVRCSDCHMYFKDRQSLLQHNLKKHQPIICDVCGNLFKRRRDLETHLRKYHCEDLDKADDLICPFEGCRKAFQRIS